MHFELANSELLLHRFRVRRNVMLFACLVCGIQSQSRAADLLVADRLSNSVYRYSESGTLLNTVVPFSFEWVQPTGIAMSPDFTKLYLSSSQRNRVWRFDYNAANGTTSNATIFADVTDGLDFPNDIEFSPDGDTIYVANLDGGVSRFNLDGSSAGAKMFLPTSDEGYATPVASMNFTTSGKLLAAAFQDVSEAGGGVAISNAAVSAITEHFVEYTSEIRGATGMMIHDNYLYVSGLESARIRRFALPDDENDPSWGQMDASWIVPNIAFPQDLAVMPDGNSFLAGSLGTVPGGGKINRYSFTGTLIGEFAAPSAAGFDEATAFVFVPTPAPLLTGDFNNDGVVDAADYVVWRKAAPNATLPNDDSPGTVDGTDYEGWRTNFGNSLPPGSGGTGGSVPEPASVMMFVVAIVTASIIRRRI